LRLEEFLRFGGRSWSPSAEMIAGGVEALSAFASTAAAR
jgi:hypothetical protein